MWVNMALQFNFFKHTPMIQRRHWWLQNITGKISGDKVISDQCMRRLKEFDCSKVDPFLPPWTSSLLRKKNVRHMPILTSHPLRVMGIRLVTLSLPEWIATSIHANKPLWHYFHKVPFVFLSCCKMKFRKFCCIWLCPLIIGVKRLKFY